MKTLKWGSLNVAWFELDDVQAIARAIEEGSIDGVVLDKRHTPSGLPVELFGLPSFDALVLAEPEGLELSRLTSLARLKLLSLGEGKRTGIDLTQFALLEDLTIAPQADDVLPAATAPLRRLVLRQYKPASKSLTEVPAYGSLVDLEVVQCRLTSLDGVQRFVHLQSLGLFHCKDLVTLDALAGTSVTSLHIDTCKKIVDVESLSKLPVLGKLVLSNMPPLRSLRFIEKFQALEEFRFVKTDVEDGDMRPLLRLNEVGFLDQRSFNMTVREVNAHIVSRTAPA
jgi:hypothetical protein